MWRFIGAEKGIEPLPGIPLEASDEEFREAVAAYEEQFGDPGCIERSGLYQRVSDRTARRQAAEEQEGE